MKNYFLILNVFLLVNCSFNSNRKNNEEDKKDAEKVTQKFYTLIKQNNRKAAFSLFSNRFFRVTNEKQLNQMIDIAQKEGGAISNYTLSNWETTIVKGTDPKSEYMMIYEVKRETIDTQEIFSLCKEADSIRIVGYKIDFDTSKK